MKLTETLYESVVDLHENQQIVLQQATQEFNEKAEEDLTPDELQEVACTSPDSVELPTDANNEQKQKFEEFKAKVKQMVKAKDIAGLKQAKRQLKELKNQSKQQQQNEQAFTGTIYTILGIQMPLGFVIFLYGFLLLLILNGLLSLFGIHLIKTITYWCTGRRSSGFGVRFGRD